tara:strand:- start:798 stop:1490 length:693 start_codon:yes stop_codon:yes gene_type:complete
MNFNSVNLLEELHKEREKLAKKEVIQEVNEILNQASAKDLEILEKLENGSGNLVIPKERLNADAIFDINEIKNLCLKYRLRFLDSSLFKGEIPYEGISKIKSLENELDCSLTNFKVLAPKELFHLTDKDSDPILFLKLSETKFYFIHKWGGEINRFRALLAYPMRSFSTMFSFLLGVAFIFSWLIPTPNQTVFLFLFVHSFIGICGIACMVVMGMRENFSNVEWDSKYLS